MNPSEPQTYTLSVIVPVYNEERSIVGVLDRLRKVLPSCGLEAFEILVVDDGSTDRTPGVLRDCQDVTVIRHAINRGYGAALKSGIRRARHDWICIVDGDGTYPIERIPDLMAASAGADMAIGARTGEDVEYPWLRRIPKAFLKRFAEWICRERIEDLNSGFRIFTREAAERLLHLLPDGFSFTATMTIAMMTNDQVVRFVAISYGPRIGRSKIRPIRDTFNFLLLIVRTGTYFSPFRVFMPVGFVLLLLFAVSAFYDAFVLKDLTEKTMILLTLGMDVAMFALLADMIQKRSGR